MSLRRESSASSDSADSPGASAEAAAALIKQLRADLIDSKRKQSQLVRDVADRDR